MGLLSKCSFGGSISIDRFRALQCRPHIGTDVVPADYFFELGLMHKLCRLLARSTEDQGSSAEEMQGPIIHKSGRRGIEVWQHAASRSFHAEPEFTGASFE